MSEHHRLEGKDHTLSGNGMSVWDRAQRHKMPVGKRIYLSGDKRDGYQVIIKGDTAVAVVFRIQVPSYRAGNAVVRALRDLDATHGIW